MYVLDVGVQSLGYGSDVFVTLSRPLFERVERLQSKVGSVDERPY
jgi:hypothetical protein